MKDIRYLSVPRMPMPRTAEAIVRAPREQWLREAPAEAASLGLVEQWILAGGASVPVRPLRLDLDRRALTQMYLVHCPHCHTLNKNYIGGYDHTFICISSSCIQKFSPRTTWRRTLITNLKRLRRFLARCMTIASPSLRPR